MNVRTWLMPIVFVAAAAAAREARAGCPEILDYLADIGRDVVCFESADLTTNNPLTTPANNSIAGLPPSAYTPITDRTTIAPIPPPVPTKVVPGVQVTGWFRDDPAGMARFLLRFPRDWNGKLVVAGASGTRSEHNGDYEWSDKAVQEGYAYASQNKGALNFFFTTPADPLACQFLPTGPFSGLYLHFYANEQPWTRWTDYMVEAARLARDVANVQYGKHPRRTYAVGVSNGGYQVRRAVEAAPDLFDGGVDWEGTYHATLMPALEAGVKKLPAYKASGFDAGSAAAQAMRAAGWPPDLVRNGVSLWELNYNSFWYFTLCHFYRTFDPSYQGRPEEYDFAARAADPATGLLQRLAQVTATGKIKKPLVTLQGTMDGLLPIRVQGRAYEAAVDASRKGNDDHRSALHRYYEIQNGTHIEDHKARFFPNDIELIEPHAHRAFDLLVAHVEDGAPLPPDQCVPRGGAISATPAQPGHCASLLAP